MTKLLREKFSSSLRNAIYGCCISAVDGQQVFSIRHGTAELINRQRNYFAGSSIILPVHSVVTVTAMAKVT